MTENKPIKVFKAGGVRAAIWENTIKRNGNDATVYSVQLDRTYKQGEEWKTTSSFQLNDLAKVQLVASKAYEYLTMKGVNRSTETE